MIRKLLAGALVSICALNVHAEISDYEDINGNNPRFDEYYTVSTQSPTNLHDAPKNRMDPWIAAQELFDSSAVIGEIKAAVISLLHFDHHNEDYGNVGQPYNRKSHFGGWIYPSHDNSCLNTRGLVLARDSSIPVTMNSSGCSVVSGQWAEPYTGKTVTQASEIQIDHFVPLKNAYVSGAHKWNYSKRCLYANFMGNNFQLLATDGPENMRKSDNTPERYMPPNRAYSCQYLAQWLKVKLIWDLGLTPPEKQVVENLVQQNHCDPKQFQYTVSELQTQKRLMVDNANLCH
ncbi:HNH endonuclease family protein [Bdellovibrio sp. HCB288]|uniref:HNH endonuclease family protein n=1 Tax=Bdellovibrio sp. HCB288 TaxID=3394355 RepID=UPI0039B4B8F0